MILQKEWIAKFTTLAQIGTCRKKLDLTKTDSSEQFANASINYFRGLCE